MYGTITENKPKKLFFIFEFSNTILLMKIIENCFEKTVLKNSFLRNVLKDIAKKSLKNFDTWGNFFF